MNTLLNLLVSLAVGAVEEAAKRATQWDQARWERKVSGEVADAKRIEDDAFENGR